MSDEAKNSDGAVVDRKTEQTAETPLDVFRRSAGFQIMFVLHSGLEVGKAIDHLCASAEKFSAAQREWQPIETAPKDGRTFLVADAGTEFIDRAFFLSPTELIIVGGQYKPTHWLPLPEPPCLSISNHPAHGQASKSESVE